MRSKLLVLVAATSTLEYRQNVLKDMTAKFGAACEVVVCTAEDFSAELRATSVKVDVSVYDIRNRYTDNYIPVDRPSKKELRTSPYAKFDKFHHKRKKK